MIRISLNAVLIISLSFMMMLGTFVCDEAQAMDYDKYKKKLKEINIPHIQKQLQLLDDLPPDTIANRVRKELNGMHVEIDYFEEEMDDVWHEVNDNTIEIKRLKRFIYDMELHKEGTKLQNEKTTTTFLQGGGIVGIILVGTIRLF